MQQLFPLGACVHMHPFPRLCVGHSGCQCETKATFFTSPRGWRGLRSPNNQHVFFIRHIYRLGHEKEEQELKFTVPGYYQSPIVSVPSLWCTATWRSSHPSCHSRSNSSWAERESFYRVPAPVAWSFSSCLSARRHGDCSETLPGVSFLLTLLSHCSWCFWLLTVVSDCLLM